MERLVAKIGESNLLRLLGRAMQTISEGVLIMDASLQDNPIIYASPSIERLTGYAPQEVVGKNYRLFQGRDTDREKVAELCRAMREGRTCSVEMLNYRKDGTPFRNSMSISPVFEGERLTHFVGVLADGTDRRQAETMLQANEAMSGALIEQSIVGFYIIQGDRYIYASPKFADMLGYTADEMTARPMFDFIAVEDRSLVTDNIRKRLEGLVRSVHYQLRMYHRDGRVVRAEAHGCRGEYAGQPAIVGVVIDISEQVQAKETVERLAALVSSSEDAIIGINLDGLVTDWNRGAELLLGYSAAEIAGQSILMLVPYGERSRADQTLARLRRGEAIPTYEAMRIRKDGSKVAVSVRLSQIKHGDHLLGYSLIYRDLTESRKLEEQLRQSQKMDAIGQLAGGVAHDFNNLLTIINGYSELLLGQPGNMPMRSLLTEIHRAGERAATLTRQLLAFSRQQVLAPKVLDLNVEVGDTEKMLRRLIGEDIILTCVMDPSIGRVKVDPGQLQQVLMNLAVNARDAMPQGGRLTLETRKATLDAASVKLMPGCTPGDYVLLSVADTGNGMDENTKARIFEPFFTTKGVGKGTGLGLAVVHGIIKQSGGHVAVYSEVGRGTTFKLYLPEEKDRWTSGKSHPGIRIMPRGSETLLLVEDDDAVRALTRHVLRSCGYTVLEAGNGLDALSVAEAHTGSIDLLISDVVMPHLGGRQLAECLAAVRPDMKVLFVSGYTDDAVVRHGVLQAEYAFVQKPFTPSALAQKVRQVLDEKT